MDVDGGGEGLNPGLVDLGGFREQRKKMESIGKPRSGIDRGFESVERGDGDIEEAISERNLEAKKRVGDERNHEEKKFDGSAMGVNLLNGKFQKEDSGKFGAGKNRRLGGFREKVVDVRPIFDETATADRSDDGASFGDGKVVFKGLGREIDLMRPKMKVVKINQSGVASGIDQLFDRNRERKSAKNGFHRRTFGTDIAMKIYNEFLLADQFELNFHLFVDPQQARRRRRMLQQKAQAL